MSTRSARPAPPRMPGGELTLEPPPEPERMVPAGVLQPNPLSPAPRVG